MTTWADAGYVRDEAPPFRVWVCLCGPFLAGEDPGTVWQKRPTSTEQCQEWDCGWAYLNWEGE